MVKRSGPASAPRKGVNTRITNELRTSLQAAADASGRSLGAEIEARLAASLEPADDLRTLIREEICRALGGNVVAVDSRFGHNILADCPANEAEHARRRSQIGQHFGYAPTDT